MGLGALIGPRKAVEPPFTREGYRTSPGRENAPRLFRPQAIFSGLEADL
jgi:hypothetical protein